MEHDVIVDRRSADTKAFNSAFGLFTTSPDGFECKLEQYLSNLYDKNHNFVKDESGNYVCKATYEWHIPARCPNKTEARKYIRGMKKLWKYSQPTVFENMGASVHGNYNSQTEKFWKLRLQLSWEQALAIADGATPQITSYVDGSYSVNV